jgi:hypothetical protein
MALLAAVALQAAAACQFVQNEFFFLDFAKPPDPPAGCAAEPPW